MRWSLGLLLLGLVLSCSGCVPYGQALEDTVAALNARQIRSCIYAKGLYRPFVSVDVIMFTGGATIETCHGRGDGQRIHPSPPDTQCPPTCEE